MSKRKPPPDSPRPNCRCCRKPLPPFRWHGEEGFEGREWGRKGDNFFCGVSCGYDYALRQVAANG